MPSNRMIIENHGKIENKEPPFLSWPFFPYCHQKQYISKNALYLVGGHMVSPSERNHYKKRQKTCKSNAEPFIRVCRLFGLNEASYSDGLKLTITTRLTISRYVLPLVPQGRRQGSRQGSRQTPATNLWPFLANCFLNYFVVFNSTLFARYLEGSLFSYFHLFSGRVLLQNYGLLFGALL
jgi:hypothetical protein